MGNRRPCGCDLYEVSNFSYKFEDQLLDVYFLLTYPTSQVLFMPQGHGTCAKQSRALLAEFPGSPVTTRPSNSNCDVHVEIKN